LDLTTIVGLIMGMVALVGGMIFKGADVSALANPAAIMIILVGTTAAVTVAFPGSHLKKVTKLFKLVFTNRKNEMSHKDILDLFMRWTTESRKNGILSLEKELKELEDEFIKKGLKFVIDGVTAHELEALMENEIDAMEERHAKGALTFTQAGTYAPTLGVMGAVVGLIAALGNLADTEKLGHAIAGAFVATLYGIFTGYVIWHPFANKLKQKSGEEIAKKRLILQCLLLLQAGAYPFLIENRILGSISATERQAITAKPEDKQ